MQQYNWKVTPEESGMRLIAFLQKKLGSSFSARRIKQLLESNRCTINHRKERFGSAIVGNGDQISLMLDVQAKSSSVKPQILYEDDALLILDKPAGTPSESDHLLISKDLRLVHRLDRDTTGALIFAKSDQIFNAMLSLFKQRQVHKEYLAIVDGSPKENQGIIDNYLGEIHRYQGQKIWGEVKKGLHAITEWVCEKRSPSAALLRCIPKTGRTHQIRVHLSSIGHPILGDYHYAKTFRCTFQPNRVLLHASMLSFPHPEQQEKIVKATAPLPSDFKNAIQLLFYEDSHR